MSVAAEAAKKPGDTYLSLGASRPVKCVGAKGGPLGLIEMIFLCQPHLLKVCVCAQVGSSGFPQFKEPAQRVAHFVQIGSTKSWPSAIGVTPIRYAFRQSQVLENMGGSSLLKVPLLWF